MAGACRARQVQEEQAVMAKIGVLSTRTRVEEKQLIAALAVAGVAALPVPPAALPSPLGPSPVQPLAVTTVSGVAAEVMIDRLQDRALASAALRLVQANGGTWIGAGLAATENRLTVATTLARAGVARPESRLVFDEGSALTAIEAVSYPCSFTPLESKLASIVLADRDTAEAVMEHRDVLGARHEALVSAHAFSLAIAAAQALHADIVGISVMRTASGLVVWDVDPVPDFRSSVSIGSAPVA